MRERARMGFPVGSIGDILANMFLGKTTSCEASQLRRKSNLLQ
jgi:hypothetical protein